MNSSRLSIESVKFLQRYLSNVFFIGLVFFIVACFKRGSLPGHQAIVPDLLKDPIQENVAKKEFSFVYADERYRVQPVASYELWGLVVGHNNITSFADIYHTSKSVDTKDIGVIWGKNLKNDDFHRVTFWSGSWSINWRYPRDVKFFHDSIANNHLISSENSIRREIAKIRIGDQVHLKGLLVNYQASSMPEFWRRSSTSRLDTGGTACEVVFVESIKILKKGTPIWYLIADFTKWLVPFVLLAKILLGILCPLPPTLPADEF